MAYLKLTTPTNIAEEEKKFFSQTDYSPQFTYQWDETSVARCKQSYPRVANLLDAVLRQDASDIAEEAKQFFDIAFRPADIALAKQMITATPRVSNDTADDYAAVLRRKLADLNIDYRVEIVDKHGFQGRPDHAEHVMRISKYLHLQFYSAEDAANHELVHIIRAVNGTSNGIAVSAAYLPTEEGLACLVQDKLLLQPSAPSFQHALEYTAAELSQRAGFREVYQLLIDHGCDTRNAWLRAIRQKFGLCDTSQPGGLAKSGMYFYHEQLLRELTKDELIRLFVGKIPDSDLHKYPIYTGQVPQEAIETLWS